MEAIEETELKGALLVFVVVVFVTTLLLRTDSSLFD